MTSTVEVKKNVTSMEVSGCILRMFLLKRSSMKKEDMETEVGLCFCHSYVPSG